jgi:hypothetical protein
MGLARLMRATMVFKVILKLTHTHYTLSVSLSLSLLHKKLHTLGFFLFISLSQTLYVNT